jgi:hypothetical protein
LSRLPSHTHRLRNLVQLLTITPKSLTGRQRANNSTLMFAGYHPLPMPRFQECTSVPGRHHHAVEERLNQWCRPAGFRKRAVFPQSSVSIQLFAWQSSGYASPFHGGSPCRSHVGWGKEKKRGATLSVPHLLQCGDKFLIYRNYVASALLVTRWGFHSCCAVL